MKKIVIIFTGGTFSMKIDENTGSAVPHFLGEQLLAMIPEAKGLAEIEICNYGNYPGPHMTPERMFEVSKTVRRYLMRKDIDGAIITHGTDT